MLGRGYIPRESTQVTAGVRGCSLEGAESIGQLQGLWRGAEANPGSKPGGKASGSFEVFTELRPLE